MNIPLSLTKTYTVFAVAVIICLFCCVNAQDFFWDEHISYATCNFEQAPEEFYNPLKDAIDKVLPEAPHYYGNAYRITQPGPFDLTIFVEGKCLGNSLDFQECRNCLR